ncbi:PAS domain S-box protein [Methanobacterium ferruginis]|uniref:PAS domain S-box protein n=1 Tax=Methanobacterium ferruginis TaxID=710191 RepID=UPI00257426DB|nr:PAS domain S-box protein [Methanobacterium ferruginis]
MILKRKDINQSWIVSYNSSAVYEKEDELKFIVFNIRDITQSQKNEEEMRKLADIVKSSDDAILSKSLNGEITSWNDGAMLIYGYSADEVLGKDISILAPPERKDETKELIEKIKNGEHIHHYESVRIGKNGKRIYVSLNLSPIFDISGNLIGISAISRDITLQKKARLALQRELTINQALSKIYSPLISPGKTISEISMIISNETLGLTDSEHCFVATIDPKNQDLINHTLTRATPECRVYEEGEISEEIIFHIGHDGLYPGLWGHCLNTKQAFYTNDAKNHHSAKGVPKGHIPIEKFLAVPILIDKELVGIIALANPYNKDYDDEDVDAVWRVADFFALAIQRKRYEDKISKALNEKEILLKEIHHRVKNNLMIISSLLNIQSRYLKDEESRSIFKESQNRAKSMALIHQRLYESVDLKNIGFKEYITTLANDLYRSYVKDPSRVNLKLEIEGVNVDINLAIPLGLILNELITNSLKYAFPDMEKGTVEVAFGKKGDKFYLKVSDNGVGLLKMLTGRIQIH